MTQLAERLRVSGTKASRPALDAMLKDAKHDKFQVLLVWRLDRLGRSLSHLLRIMEILQACHVDLVSYSEGLDFSTASGKLMTNCWRLSANLSATRSANGFAVDCVTPGLKGSALAAPVSMRC